MHRPRFQPGGYVAGPAEWSKLDLGAIRRALGAHPDPAELARRAKRSRYVVGRFHNEEPTSLALDASPARVAAQMVFGGEIRVPGTPLPVLPRTGAELARHSGTGLRTTWLGHSSVLVEIEGVRILTDPVFSERIGPSPVIGPRRFHPVPVSVPELPPLDAILVSHDHYDHLDLATIDALAPRGERFVVPLGVGTHLRAWGIADERIVELDWWEEVAIRDGVRIRALPSRHFSGRGPNDRMRTLWASWALLGREKKVFFSGDTGYHGSFGRIGEEVGSFDLAMLEVGAFHPAWWRIHLGPENASRAFGELGAKLFLPIHWGTYSLAMHHWWDPIEGVLSHFGGRGHRFATPRPGESVEPGVSLPDDAWWRPFVR